MSNLDEYYSYDALSRLSQMQRGTLNSTKTGIVGTPALEQDWTLDPTGNWNGYQNQTSGTTSLSQTRSHNKVNAITGITSTPFWPTPPEYDAAGNTRFFPSAQNPEGAMRGVYDAWNRLVAVDAGDDLEEDDWGSSSSSSSGPSLLSQYRYDGFNRRISQIDYSSGSGQSMDYYFSFNWQLLQEIGEGEANRQYVYGIRYVDELVCFDPMGTPTYICQDANWNVTSLVDASGDVLEHYSYTPYGVQSVYDASWNPEEESSYDWQFGHQGLFIDDVSDLLYNRNRWLHPQLGRFMQRDPMGYDDGLNLYQYTDGSPVDRLDPLGDRAKAGKSSKAAAAKSSKTQNNRSKNTSTQDSSPPSPPVLPSPPVVPPVNFNNPPPSPPNPLSIIGDYLDCLLQLASDNQDLLDYCTQALALCATVPGLENPFCYAALGCAGAAGAACLPAPPPLPTPNNNCNNNQNNPLPGPPIQWGGGSFGGGGAGGSW